MLNKIMEFIKTHKLFVFLVFVTIIKQVIVSNIPIWVLANELYDDHMMVTMANNILSGSWLGIYNSNTLVKGCFFPLLLVIMRIFGLSYIPTMNLIYSLSCIYFIYTIKDLFKNKKLLGILYLVLLLNPVSYAAWTAQRVYRNGVTISQVLIIIGSMFAIYSNIKEKGIKKALVYSIVGGLALGSFWNTREDGIWILPFVLVVTIVVVVLSIIKYKNELKLCLKKIMVGILPMLILMCCMNLIRLINYKVYGVFVYNEINDGYFGKTIQSLYSIKTDENIQYVTVTKEKINIACEASPTLNSIKTQLINSIDAWDVCDRTPNDGQVEDGWFWWTFKAAVESSGHYRTASESNEFYKKVYEELEQAKKENKFETQFTMPAKLMSPWKSEYFTKEICTMGEMLSYMINFETVSVINGEGKYIGDSSVIRDYEALTNNFAINPIKKEYKAGGWYVPISDEEFTLQLVDENNQVLQNIEKESSNDVYNVLKGTNNDLSNAYKCRFNFEINLDEEKSVKDIYLVSKNKDGNVIEKIKIDSNDKGGITDKSIYSFDYVNTPEADSYSKYSIIYVNILNKISSIYKATGLIIAIISIVMYIIITINMIAKREQKTINLWLLETGLLCSLLVLVAGVSYNHITACNSKFYMYLSGGYPLIIAFCWIAIIYVLDNNKNLFNFKKEKIMIESKD